MFRPAPLACLLMLSLPALAQQRGGYNQGYGTMAPAVQGIAFPRLSAIARAAASGGTLIGSDYDQQSATYRFKFIKTGRVTWVDVDAYSGQVLKVEEGG